MMVYIYAFTDKHGISSLIFRIWDDLYEKYSNFCDLHTIPKIGSFELFEIIEHYYYYKMYLSEDVHYYIIKTFYHLE